MTKIPPATYATHAAFMLVAGYFPRSVVLQALRKTMLFWAAYENIELTKQLSESQLREFAKLFRRSLKAQGLSGDDLSSCDANAAALAAIREWWRPCRDLAERM